MTRILILGGNGMLGHKLFGVLSSRFDVWATLRGSKEMYKKFNILQLDRLIENTDATNIQNVQKTFEEVNPTVVVNALGIVKQRDEAKNSISSIQINSLFPHQLAEICASKNTRLIQISTDCVFSGLRGSYTESDNPDPVDLYGKTKLLGELHYRNCLTLRTSIIGWQINTFSSLLSWFSQQRGRKIKGYKKAIYSGFSTSVLSNLIGDLIETRPDLYGLYQVASKPISKYDLLFRLKDELGWTDIQIEPDESFFCDRSLSSIRFNTLTGWLSPEWESMIRNLALEWHQYKMWYPNFN